LIGERQLSNSPHAATLDPRPDICVKLNFNSFGPGISSAFEFAGDLRRRIAAATGERSTSAIIDAIPLPPLEGRLEFREISEKGEMSRVYIHDACGNATEVTGGSLRWVTNPLRYAPGSHCATCGSTLNGLLRWEDTGETVARFRSRMWRQTPLIIKLSQYVFLPTAIGVLSAILFPSSPKLSPAAAMVTSFVVGYLAAILLICLTPLAGILPALAGLKYHKYR
jgi:hypothetical protein